MRFVILAILAVFSSAGCAQLPVTLGKSLEPPAGPRLRIFISDLHFGAGHVLKDSTGNHTQGPWHPTEDFRWHDDFKAFLGEVRALGKDRGVSVDLVIVGDFLELWQAAPKICSLEECTPAERAGTAPRDCEYKDKEDLGCTEEEAAKRVQRVLGAHKDTLAELGKFAAEGDNRVVIVVGNHDAALVFKRVADATLVAIGAPGRVHVATEGYWLSRDGLIFAEHGHQVEGDVNAYDSLPASCINSQLARVDCATGLQNAYLKRPWGENFVQKYYEQYEVRFPIIDNVSSMDEGIRLGIMAAGIGDTLDALRKGFKFLLLQQSRAQVAAGLGKTGKELLDYDLKAVRQRGDAFLVESFVMPEGGAAMRDAAGKVLDEGKLSERMTNFTDDELRTLCDFREATRRMEMSGTVRTPACPRLKEATLGGDDDGSLGAIATQIFTTEKGRYRSRLSELRGALNNSGRPTADFELYVYAHTHAAHGKVQPFGGNEKWSPVMFNTGAWQRIATPKQLETIRADQKIDTWQTLLALSPGNLPPCYSFILVEPYAEGARADIKPALRWWAQPKGGDWTMMLSCPY